MAPLTSIGLGGQARFFVECDNEDELHQAVEFARSQQLPIHVLGGGSNTIFSDRGYDGLVIKVACRGMDFFADGAVKVGAGEVWDSFVQAAIEKDLAGIECLSGIPGLVGATPIQNVGAYGQEVAGTIAGVEALEIDSLKVVSFSSGQCRFSYRSSYFKGEGRGRYIIISVLFNLVPGGVPQLKYPELADRLREQKNDIQSAGNIPLAKVRQAVLQLRRRKSMLLDKNDPHSKSCGSFFLNPLLTKKGLALLKTRLPQTLAAQLPVFPAGDRYKVSAAWLIEQAGFRKGYRHGAAGISANHTLALVNYGSSTEELLALATQIQTTVRERLGVTLVFEPDVV